MTFVLKYRYAYLCLFCLGLQNSVSGDKEMALRLEKGGGEKKRERQTGVRKGGGRCKKLLLTYAVSLFNLTQYSSSS